MTLPKPGHDEQAPMDTQVLTPADLAPHIPFCETCHDSSHHSKWSLMSSTGQHVQAKKL
jgi:hypothetical protein